MDVFKQLELIKQQNEREDAIRCDMLEILEANDVGEDDIPLNENVSMGMLKNVEDKFAAIQNSDLDYIKVEEFLCFKVDDQTSGTEDIYFISPTGTLYLENGCLSIF